MTQVTPAPKQFTFTRVNNNWLDYLADGSLDPLSFTLLIVLHRQTDYATGVWKGCAERLLYAVGSDLSLRAIQYRLRFLQDAGFLQSTHISGKRGFYTVVLNNFIPTAGAAKGTVLRPTEIISAIPKWQSQRSAQRNVCEVDRATSANPTSSLTPVSEVISATSAKRSAKGNSHNQDTQDTQDSSKQKPKTIQDADPAFRRVLCSETENGEGAEVVRHNFSSANPASQRKSDEAEFADVPNTPPLPKWSGREGCFFDGDRKLSMSDAARRFEAVGMSHLDAINDQTGGAQ
jgi:hypothetical protein